MIGSSLGGYLSLVADPHRVMHATRCVNIFHPLDPLAQRLEPWISPDIWAENLSTVAFDKLDFPLQNVPQPVSAALFLERNAGHSPHRFDCSCTFTSLIWLITIHHQNSISTET
jgi:hypothetical protein